MVPVAIATVLIGDQTWGRCRLTHWQVHLLLLGFHLVDEILITLEQKILSIRDWHASIDQS